MSDKRKTIGDELREGAERVRREREEEERRRERSREKKLRAEEADAQAKAEAEAGPIFDRCLAKARAEMRLGKRSADELIEETEQRDGFDRRSDDVPEHRRLKLRKYACDEAAKRLTGEGVAARAEIDVWDDTERGGAEDYYPKNVRYRLVIRMTW